MKYATKPLTIPLWRMIHPRRDRNPLSGEGARLWGGRWNMKGWPALYLATDPATAIAEYYQGNPKPGMLVPYRLETGRIADLTEPDEQISEALACHWDEIARRQGQVPPSWALAHELIADGVDGALVLSVQNRGGRNLVLWRWHDAREEGEGAALKVLDPEAALTGRA
jgi:RES domain-containing protein